MMLRRSAGEKRNERKRIWAQVILAAAMMTISVPAYAVTVWEHALAAKYPESSFVYSGGSLEGYGFGADDTPYTWLMGPQGITFYFNPYEIASYAEGCLSVEISYEEQPALFRDDYCMNGSFAYAEPYWWEGIPLDLDGSGDLEKITITPNYTDYSQIESVQIGVEGETQGGSCLIGDMWCYAILPVVMHLEDGRTYLYLDALSDNDWHSLFIADLGGPEPRMMTTYSREGLFELYSDPADAVFRTLPIDPDRFVLSSRFALLGTYCGQRAYRAGEEGPVPLEDIYTVPSAHSLHTIKDLPAGELDASTGMPTGSEVTIPAGEYLTIVRTDGDSFADVRRGDGSEVRIYVDAYVWPHTIMGEDEADFFEMLYYAG